MKSMKSDLKRKEQLLKNLLKLQAELQEHVGRVRWEIREIKVEIKEHHDQETARDRKVVVELRDRKLTKALTKLLMSATD